MSMANGYTFEVEAVHPAGLPHVNGGHATANRKFKMMCKYAEEFGLRQIGKFYHNDASALLDYFIPQLPSTYPVDSSDDLNKSYGRIEMVVSGFTIEALSPCCFNAMNAEGQISMTDPESISRQELYWYRDDVVTANPDANDECDCIATLNYEDPPWDCRWDDTGNTILVNTAFSVDRNASYEMFTLPSRNLEWVQLVGGAALTDPDKRLKDDSYAYTIIPKADVTITWYNVPVYALCLIEEHLATYRGNVNQFSADSMFFCGYSGAESGPAGCDQYAAETLLFVDWQEDRSQRTTSFKNRTLTAGTIDMNTTTLKLMFKQKHVIDPFLGTAVGWNHLFYDRGNDDSTSPVWRRVGIRTAGGLEPLFPVMDFSNLMNPTIP